MKKLYKFRKNINLICTFLCLIIFAQVFIFPGVGAMAYKTSTVIVSLGDSYSSGEGIPPFYGEDLPTEKKVKNLDWLAHRSQKSWPGNLTLPGVEGTMSNNLNTNWYNVATAGATTKHLTESFRIDYDHLGYTGYENIPPQLDVFKELGDKKADYVTVTLGGNDADFVGVVTDAAFATLNPDLLSTRLDKVWAEFYREGGIRDNLKQAYINISTAAGQQAAIIVAGYPTLIHENGGGFLFKKENVTLLNQAVSKFNDEIENIVNSCRAEGMNIHFVSVEEEFKGHEAYSAEPYLNPVMVKQSQDITGALISSYSMHPNEKGAEIYTRCVQKKIDEIEEGKSKETPPDESLPDVLNYFKSFNSIIIDGLKIITKKSV